VAAKVRERAVAFGVQEPRVLDGGEGVGGAGVIDVGAFLMGESYAALRVLPLLFGVDVGVPSMAAHAAAAERWLPQLRQHHLDKASLQLRTRPGELHLRLLW
jgi:hypothetical protein